MAGNATAWNAEVYAQGIARETRGRNLGAGRIVPTDESQVGEHRQHLLPDDRPGDGQALRPRARRRPARRRHPLLRGDAPGMALTDQQTSLAFDLMAAPNHRGHVVGPGEYQLDIRVAAENARPIQRTVAGVQTQKRGSLYA
jgi:hypothetical protein